VIGSDPGGVPGLDYNSGRYAAMPISPLSRVGKQICRRDHQTLAGGRNPKSSRNAWTQGSACVHPNLRNCVDLCILFRHGWVGGGECSVSPFFIDTARSPGSLPSAHEDAPPASVGAGNGSFPPIRCRLIRGQAGAAVTTCMKAPSRAKSARQADGRISRSVRPRTASAILSRLTCSSQATTFAPCRNFSATATSRRPCSIRTC
jgi:hypothetical protein